MVVQEAVKGRAAHPHGLGCLGLVASGASERFAHDLQGELARWTPAEVGLAASRGVADGVVPGELNRSANLLGAGQGAGQAIHVAASEGFTERHRKVQVEHP